VFLYSIWVSEYVIMIMCLHVTDIHL